MSHILSALVHHVPGVLSSISGMLASRGYNIDSLAVGETINRSDPDIKLARMTLVFDGDEKVLEQVRKQLEKMVTVVEVEEISQTNFLERDLMLIKVSSESGKRTEIKELVDIFRGKIVDISHDSMIIEISGQEKKIQAFIDILRPFKILDLVRTGQIAMSRGATVVF